MSIRAIAPSHLLRNVTYKNRGCTPAWRQVTVLKKDEKGRIVRDLDTGKLQKVKFDMETKSGDLYWHESKLEIALKCAGLFLITPLFTAGVVAWNLGRMPIDISRLIYKALRSDPSPAAILKTFTWKIPRRLGMDVWNVVRAPFYALGVEVTSAYGVISPYRGRKWEAIVEQAWQNKVSFRKDFRCCDPKTGRWLYDFMYGVKHGKAFYLAWCFQKRHHIDDQDVTEVSGE